MFLHKTKFYPGVKQGQFVILQSLSSRPLSRLSTVHWANMDLKVIFRGLDYMGLSRVFQLNLANCSSVVDKPEHPTSKHFLLKYSSAFNRQKLETLTSYSHCSGLETRENNLSLKQCKKIFFATIRNIFNMMIKSINDYWSIQLSYNINCHWLTALLWFYLQIVFQQNNCEAFKGNGNPCRRGHSV